MRRCVLVTGGSRGIGAAAARAFGAAGDRVAVHYASRRDRAEAVAAALPGDGHVVVGADLADAGAVRRMVDEAAAALGRIDVLVNNAGVFAPHPITETSYEEWQRAWERTLGVNLVGAANVTWCAVRHMGRGGRIVNVASRGAFRGEPGQPGYGASKAGLVAFGQSLARALGPLGIAVTSVAPGLTDTDMAADALAGEKLRAAGGEPARPPRDGRGRRRRDPLSRLARGGARERHCPRRQWSVIPADVSVALRPGVRGELTTHAVQNSPRTDREADSSPPYPAAVDVRGATNIR